MPPAEGPHAAPSPLLLAHLDELRACATRGPVVDLACGRGRNAAALSRHGIAVTGIDRDRAALGAFLARCNEPSGRASAVVADLETTGEFPLRPGSCAAILVFRFLFRPLAAAIERALQPGGLLLYETFTTAQREHDWGPRRGDFLLEPGELAALFPQLEILHFDEADARDGHPEANARLAARARRQPG